MPVGQLAHQYHMRKWNTEGGGGGGSESDSSGSESDSGDTNGKAYSQADIDKLNGSLDAERKRAKDFEKDFKKVQADLKKIQDDAKPDLERLTGERDELQTKYETTLKGLRDANAKGVVAAAARDAKAISPNAVYAMIANQLEYDDDSKPTNVAALIADVQKSEPDLFTEIVNGSGDGGAGDSSANTGGMNEFIRGLAGK